MQNVQSIGLRFSDLFFRTIFTECGLDLIIMHSSIRQVDFRKPLHVKLKNTELKYLTPTEKEDHVLPALFVFQGMRA